MPAKDDAAASRSDGGGAASYRLPSDDAVEAAARRVLRAAKAVYASEAAFVEAVREVLRRDDPLTALAGERLRRVVIGLPGVRYRVRYAERNGPPPLDRCPVCRDPLVAIRNRTLLGETVELGRRCARCAYWSLGRRRVPVRYVVSRSGSLRWAEARPERRGNRGRGRAAS